MATKITTEPVSAALLSRDTAYPECGALCSFEGVVRNHHGGRAVLKLNYEAFVPMAESELKRLKDEIESEWPMCHVRMSHRIGALEIGDTAVAIVVWAPHRAEAFDACEAAIDRLKKRLPVWKREFYADGTTSWVVCEHGRPT